MTAKEAATSASSGLRRCTLLPAPVGKAELTDDADWCHNQAQKAM